MKAFFTTAAMAGVFTLVSAASTAGQAAEKGENGGGRSLVPAELALAGLDFRTRFAPGDCTLNDALFNSQEGGCKDLITGLVWSARSTLFGTAYTWEQAGLYCQTLEEGGFDDWVLPSRDQMLEVYAHGSATHMDVLQNVWMWSTDRQGQRAWTVNLHNGMDARQPLGSVLTTICVRDPGGDPPPPPPIVQVDSISPKQMSENSTIAVTITGSGFQSGATVTFDDAPGTPPTATNVVFVDAGTLTADVTAGQNGTFKRVKWDVVVTNPDGTSGELPDGLTVRSN